MVRRWRLEYAGASKGRKGEILDILCQETGWNRQHAMAAFKELPVVPRLRRAQRARKYGPNEEAALVKVWILSDGLASKTVAPIVEEFLVTLERH